MPIIYVLQGHNDYLLRFYVNGWLKGWIARIWLSFSISCVIEVTQSGGNVAILDINVMSPRYYYSLLIKVVYTCCIQLFTALHNFCNYRPECIYFVVSSNLFTGRSSDHKIKTLSIVRSVKVVFLLNNFQKFNR